VVIILWQVDHLLGNDREIGNYTTTFTRQRPVKRNRKTMFFVRSVPRCYKQEKLGFLGPRANAELVPKFHVALHASHAALRMVTLKISPCTDVTLPLGWITLFMGDMGNCQTKKLKSGYKPHWGPGTKTNWPTDRRSQCNLKLNSRHCTANYRPVLSSDRAPYMKNKESNCHSNKYNI
jgi:hypothetical protein